MSPSDRLLIEAIRALLKPKHKKPRLGPSLQTINPLITGQESNLRPSGYKRNAPVLIFIRFGAPLPHWKYRFFQFLETAEYAERRLNVS